MIKAIVYTTNTGSTAQYAEMLGKMVQLPVFSIFDAERKLESQTEIIYLDRKSVV